MRSSKLRGGDKKIRLESVGKELRGMMSFLKDAD
jgi:hypothetical protein